MKRPAFTILEPLISITLLLITLLGLITLLMYGIKLAQFNKLREEAIYKANKLANYLSTLPFDSPCLTEGNHNCQLDNGSCCNDLHGDPNTMYIVKRVSNDIKEIEVNVVFQYSNFKGHISIFQLLGNWK